MCSILHVLIFLSFNLKEHEDGHSFDFIIDPFYRQVQPSLGGGVVKTYEPNSLTPKLSYQDPEAIIPNLPEVILDETGRAKIYLLGDYRIQVYSNDGILIEDNLLVEQALVQRDFDNLSTDIQQQVDEAKQAFENTGGFISAPTLTALQAITPEYNYQLARVDTTGDEYRRILH